MSTVGLGDCGDRPLQVRSNLISTLVLLILLRGKRVTGIAATEEEEIIAYHERETLPGRAHKVTRKAASAGHVPIHMSAVLTVVIQSARRLCLVCQRGFLEERVSVGVRSLACRHSRQ